MVCPQIPQNTGNVLRTCAAAGCRLHLVGPLGFCVSDKHLKRAGLDYWERAQIEMYQDFAEFEKANPGRYFLCTTRAKKLHTDFAYRPGDYFLFGSETTGLPPEIHEAHPDTRIRIPMKQGIRCFNLATSVGIILYEALRQGGFQGLI